MLIFGAIWQERVLKFKTPAVGSHTSQNQQ